MRRRIQSGVELLLVLALALSSQAVDSSAATQARDGKPASSWTAPQDLPAESVAKAVFDGDVAQVEARLLVSSGEAGERRAGVLFDLAPGWHLYWRNPGETGIAPKLQWAGEGVSFGEVDWPAPEIFDEADGLFTTYGYEGQVLLSVAIDPSQALKNNSPAQHIFTASPQVLVCRTECVPARIELRSAIAPALGAASQKSIDALFERTSAAFPISNQMLGGHIEAGWMGAQPKVDEAGRIAFVFSPCEKNAESCEGSVTTSGGAPFIPFEDQPFEFDEMRVIQPSGASTLWRVEMSVTRLEEDGGERLRGLVPLLDSTGRMKHIEIDAALSAVAPAALPGSSAAPIAAAAAAAAAATSESPGWIRWLQVLLLALVGGLILNGMPCVLPVLAIKVVAIADMGDKDASEVRLQGLAYTAGVLGSMTLLGVSILLLRSAGHSVGWGFQFQEPLFVAGISAVLVTFALNLFGVFEIDFGQGRLAAVGQEGSATRRSLFEGLLAVVLATPCTAPFLGTAVGFAFAAPGIGILGIFLAIGLGLALPFLIVSFVPGFARFIPRSGPWMLKLRAGLGFCLLATIVWLLWIVGQSGGTDAVIGMVAMLLLLSFLLWGFGQAQPLESAWMARASACLIAGIAITGFNLIGFEVAEDEPSETALVEQDPFGWTPYSDAAVNAALAEGRTAFVVFTADWCITCKVNEKRVIERPAARAVFAAGNVALFKADWTRRDETIRVKLAEFGRAGVPLYLVYSPENPHQPQVLSEILSHAELQAALPDPGRPHSG